ncbi:hypothetical protein CJ030_MR5G000849 [Morella rubra]|uniref:Mesoderm development candidate 2 n=1 Tax=Morella rubra TaxID=262757 RepID=A0A6A1VUM5_9ROSI|nr:hypothetical protein CJ030_MR5G000849 [Morella rubra]
MPNHVTFLLLLLLSGSLSLLISSDPVFVRVADASKRKVHITDDLDDVVDDEEDEAWKQWGKKSTPSPESDLQPSDLSKMSMSEIQAEMMKRQAGPAMGFVKLRLGVRRSRDMVTETAMKWTKVLRTGAIDAKFMAVDLTTIMFTMEIGQDTAELKDFVLSQPEAYEIKIGDQVFRRPEDPPLEEVLAKLHNEKDKMDTASPTERTIFMKNYS